MDFITPITIVSEHIDAVAEMFERGIISSVDSRDLSAEICDFLVEKGLGVQEAQCVVGSVIAYYWATAPDEYATAALLNIITHGLREYPPEVTQQTGDIIKQVQADENEPKVSTTRPRKR